MGKRPSDEEKIKALVDYYKKNGLLIVGLNDSQGVNTTTTFFKKGLLEYLASALTDEKLTPEVINVFSLTMNKTEHIDYFLRNNLTLEEIKLSQIYSVVSALEKVMEDFHLPKFLGQIGNVYKLIYNPQAGDGKIKITTELRKVEEPTVIYSSGVNNLMREMSANPFGIKKDYKTRDTRPNYYFTLERSKDPNALKSVIEGIMRNYDSILGINSKTDIYTLGAYIPKSLQTEEMNIFRDLILEYNEKLRELNKEYNGTFIDTEEVGKKFNNSEANFHISTAGHNALANYILGSMYQRKIVDGQKAKQHDFGIYEISNNGAKGVRDSALFDRDESFERIKHLTGYEREREIAIAEEHEREAKVFEKVLKKTNRN